MTNKTRAMTLLILHSLLGVIAKFVPVAFAAYYLGVILWGICQVLKTRDKDHYAAKYGLYVMGLEILYRMGGVTISYEMAKYACAGLFFCGILVRSRRSKIRPFLTYLLLLLPAIAFTHTDEGFNVWRKMVLFDFSGPICLSFAGMYFYRRKITESQLWSILRLAVLPAVSTVVFLSVGPAISTVSFNAESNFALSGGFGPNQVSTALGYFLVLLFFTIWNRQVLTCNKWADYALAIVLAFRVLVTFSRGGIFAFGIAVLVSMVGMTVLSKAYRKRLGKHGVAVILLAGMLGGVFSVANKMTNNWLLYRYQGKSTSEVVTGREKQDKRYLSGREMIADHQIEIFKQHWLTGVGVGMGMEESAKNYGELAASHSEPTRLLAEHGILGVVALTLLLVVYPIRRLRLRQTPLSQQFFLIFFVLGFMTMLHAAMRMALPGVVTGFAFAIIVPDYFRAMRTWPPAEDSAQGHSFDVEGRRPRRLV